MELVLLLFLEVSFFLVRLGIMEGCLILLVSFTLTEMKWVVFYQKINGCIFGYISYFLLLKIETPI